MDLESEQGREIVRGALSQLKSSLQLRVALIFNSQTPGLATKIAKAAVDSQKSNLGIRNILGKMLKENTIKDLKKGKKKLEDFDIPGKTLIFLFFCFFAPFLLLCSYFAPFLPTVFLKS